jgi:hypothetical protein
LHQVTNECGEIIDLLLTFGNENDRKSLKVKSFIQKLWGKLYGDKGYIGKDFLRIYSPKEFIY